MASCRVIDSWLRARFCGAFCRILPGLRAGSRERLAAEHHQARTRTCFAHFSCLPFRAFRRAVAFVSRLQVVLKALDTQGRFRTLDNQGRLVTGDSERPAFRGSGEVGRARFRTIGAQGRLVHTPDLQGRLVTGFFGRSTRRGGWSREVPNGRHPGELGHGGFRTIDTQGRLVTGGSPR